MQDSNARALASTLQDLATLKEEILALKGATEESRHFVQAGTQSNERILKDYDQRLTTMEEKISVLVNQMQDFLGVRPAAPTTAPSTSADPAMPDGSPEDVLYKRALAEINQQNYKGARQLLDEFLKKYPKSQMADNAQYWRGETFFASRQYPEAVMEFQKLIKQFPKSNKVPGSILKQGYSFYETKSYLDAKAFLQKVVSNYPKTGEATQARERLQKIDQLMKPPANPSQEVIR